MTKLNIKQFLVPIKNKENLQPFHFMELIKQRKRHVTRLFYYRSSIRTGQGHWSQARGESHFPHIIASGRRFICMRAADQDPLQPLLWYLINRHESYSALVFLNYMKKCQQRGNLNIPELKELAWDGLWFPLYFFLFGVTIGSGRIR